MADRYLAQLRHAEHYQVVLQTADQLYQEGGEALERGLLLLQLESVSIQAGRAWAETHSGDSDTAALLCSSYQLRGAHIFDLTEHPSRRKVWLTAALASARRLKDRFSEAAHLNDLGMVHDELGESQLAIPLYEERLIIAREVGDLHGEAKSYGNLGVAHKNLGHLERAIECFESQLSISKRIHDPRGEANALGGLGISYARMGRAERAVEYQQQSLEINRSIGDRRGEGNSIGNLAGAYFLLGDMKRADIFYHQRLAIARELADRRGEGNARWGLSLISNNAGKRANALDHAEAALKIFEELQSPSAGEVRKLLIEWGPKES